MGDRVVIQGKVDSKDMEQERVFHEEAIAVNAIKDMRYTTEEAE